MDTVPGPISNLCKAQRDATFAFKTLRRSSWSYLVKGIAEHRLDDVELPYKTKNVEPRRYKRCAKQLAESPE